MSQVQLILREDVHKLGLAGDLVEVKPGYARNFLIPQGKAMIATPSKVNELEHQKRMIEARLAKELKDVRAIAKKIGNLSLKVSAKAGEGGKLFGSVTTMQIAELLADRGFEIDRRKIALDEPIKTLGEHQVPIKIHRDVNIAVKVVVSAAGD